VSEARTITGWPAFFLVVIPMIIGWYEIIRGTVERIF